MASSASSEMIYTYTYTIYMYVYIYIYYQRWPAQRLARWSVGRGGASSWGGRACGTSPRRYRAAPGYHRARWSLMEQRQTRKPIRRWDACGTSPRRYPGTRVNLADTQGGLHNATTRVGVWSKKDRRNPIEEVKIADKHTHTHVYIYTYTHTHKYAHTQAHRQIRGAYVCGIFLYGVATISWLLQIRYVFCRI